MEAGESVRCLAGFLFFRKKYEKTLSFGGSRCISGDEPCQLYAGDFCRPGHGRLDSYVRLGQNQRNAFRILDESRIEHGHAWIY